MSIRYRLTRNSSNSLISNDSSASIDTVARSDTSSPETNSYYSFPTTDGFAWSETSYPSLFSITSNRIRSRSARESSPSLTSTMFGSDDEISITPNRPGRHLARENSSATTVTTAGSASSHEMVSRTIVLCLDASSYRPGQSSKVTPAWGSILDLESDNPTQKVFYSCSKRVGLPRNMIENQLLESYTWLCNNYKLGDKLCILGFSLGASAARKLCGMINMVGMLPPGNYEQVKFAYKYYRNAENTDPMAPRYFKETHNIESDGRTVMIDFIGLWDVSERDIPITTSPNPSIRILRQALFTKKNLTTDWSLLAERTACKLRLPTEGETPLQWITKECLLANIGLKLNKYQDQVEVPDKPMEKRVFCGFTIL